MAASSTVPTANENTTSTRAIGRPQPGACVLACGYSAWFSGVSGMVIVEPSTTRTRRPRHKPFSRCLGFEFSTAAADQLAAGRLRQGIACRAVSAGVGRTGLGTLRRPPRRQAGHRVATRMIRAEALRQKHPHRDRGRVNPTLPKRACLAERFADTLSVDQRRKVQVAMPTCFSDRGTKRMKHLGPPCRECVSFTTPSSQGGLFSPYQLAHQRLTKVQVPFVPGSCGPRELPSAVPPSL